MGRYAKAAAALAAALATGLITFLMIAFPGQLWAKAVALAVNAVLVYLVPNSPVISQAEGSPGIGQGANQVTPGT